MKRLFKILSLGILTLLLGQCLFVTITHYLGLHDHGVLRKSFTTDTIYLESNKKLVSFGFIGTSYYIITRDIRVEDKPEQYIVSFPESIIGAKYIINEAAIR